MADFRGDRNGSDYTVDVPKAKKKLTLNDLAQANSGVPSNDPVAEARAYLDRSPADPHALTHEQNAARTAALMAPVDTRGTGERLARSGVRGLGALGGLAQLASLPVGFVAPPAGAALYAGGTAAKMPERLWEGIEDPSQGMGVVEGSLEALGLLGARGASNISAERAALQGGEMAGSKVGRMAGPSRYESAVGAAENPNVQEVNPRGYLDNLLTRLNGSKAEDRSVRAVGGLQQEAPGGLSDVMAGKVRPTPYRPLQSQANALLEGAGPEPSLSPLVRASNLARKQALAKSFRTNTPLAEGF